MCGCDGEIKLFSNDTFQRYIINSQTAPSFNLKVYPAAAAVKRMGPEPDKCDQK